MKGVSKLRYSRLVSWNVDAGTHGSQIINRLPYEAPAYLILSKVEFGTIHIPIW